jgi:hypothetical protein
MIPAELAEQVRSEIKRLQGAADGFLKTYQQLCVHHGGQQWQKDASERVFHQVRLEVIPIMEQLGMDPTTIQALCSWAERVLMRR